MVKVIVGASYTLRFVFADVQNDVFDIITVAELTSKTAIKTTSAEWMSLQAGLDHTASQLQPLLDEYNNFGTVESSLFANDADLIV